MQFLIYLIHALCSYHTRAPRAITNEKLESENVRDVDQYTMPADKDTNDLKEQMEEKMEEMREMMGYMCDSLGIDQDQFIEMERDMKREVRRNGPKKAFSNILRGMADMIEECDY